MDWTWEGFLWSLCSSWTVCSNFLLHPSFSAVLTIFTLWFITLFDNLLWFLLTVSSFSLQRDELLLSYYCFFFCVVPTSSTIACFGIYLWSLYLKGMKWWARVLLTYFSLSNSINHIDGGLRMAWNCRVEKWKRMLFSIMCFLVTSSIVPVCWTFYKHWLQLAWYYYLCDGCSPHLFR